ncbi:MAG: zinc ABC transporter substrate-binding protein [Lawsonibacter sp.]|nr:zinc ABC transporter substrate-binding protein [Lawsonibacter sp.]
MKKRLIPLLLALLLLPSCAPDAGPEARLTVVCTTYPVYLFASALTEGVEGAAVERLDTGSVSCLHDYTLSVRDMRKLEGADLVALNGGGLEEFLEDALKTSPAAVVDCSEELILLENLSHHHEEGEGEHDHGHFDPHYWMDPAAAAVAAERLGRALEELDPDWAERYRDNAAALREQLEALDWELFQMFDHFQQRRPIAGLITFHDGFQYFANAYQLPLLAAIEEEAGSEASAKEIVEITALVKEYGIPVIFTEVNGSDATAQAISRETGCRVSALTMVMDGPDGSLEHYLEGLRGNARAIIRGFGAEGNP